MNRGHGNNNTGTTIRKAKSGFLRTTYIRTHLTCQQTNRWERGDVSGVYYDCMYFFSMCMYGGQHFQQSMHQSGMLVSNSARSQLNNRKNVFFHSSRLRLRTWFRERGSGVPSRISVLTLSARAQSGAYSRDSSSFPRRRTYVLLIADPKICCCVP